MASATSILHHKPPPLKTRNDINTALFLRSNNYYGSVGRPSHGRRKSAVELLQESKSFYVKSESVLDTKQEFKNADHLQVRSPTMESSPPQSHYRGGAPPPSAPPAPTSGSSFPYATFTCGTCPPYPHQHFDHNSIHLMTSNYLNSIKREGSGKRSGSKVTAKITLMEAPLTRERSGAENWDAHHRKSNSTRSRRSIQPPGTLHIMADPGTKNATPAVSKNAIGLPLHFTSLSQNGSLYSMEKHSIATANLPVITSANNSVLHHGEGQIRDRKDEAVEGDSPPPLPPKSPRVTSSKPARPNDFPQRLVQQQQQDHAVGPPDGMLPPPPPRRPHHHEPTDVHSNLRRIIHEQQKNGGGNGAEPIIPPMTLPSPILPLTPPIDVVMESPMSDSGPIISPPPAFSTPVTPMLDRQNSSVSDKSNNPYMILQKTPLSAAVSMSGVSSISSRSRKSIPDDVSMRYSPRSRSRSRSSSSPMSHQDIENPNVRETVRTGVGRVGGGRSVSSEDEESEGEAISADLEGDDDDSSRIDSSKVKRNNSKKSHSSSGVSSRPSPKKLISSQKVVLNVGAPRATPTPPMAVLPKGQKEGSGGGAGIPKSVTENFLYRVNPPPSTALEQESSFLIINSNHAAQTLPLLHHPRPRIVSPVRRPILRSKSDLSHRYIKAGRSATLTPGFTLVQVDVGQPSLRHGQSPPPPIPIHNSVSTNDFNSSGRKYEKYQQQSHNNHIYSRPTAHINATAYENLLLNGKSELDRFFDQLGLDSKGLLALLPPPCPLSKVNRDGKSGSESPVYFSSVSSVDSGARKSASGDSEVNAPIPPPLGMIIGARTAGGAAQPNNPTTNNNNNNNNGPSIVVHHGEPSIVERNARVIKWLFNCRKASDGR